ncbi:MAG: hypothetical protein WKG07_38575 [Hymenobacter sp.]
MGGFNGKRADKETYYTFTSYVYPPTIFQVRLGDRQIDGLQEIRRAIRPRASTSRSRYFTIPKTARASRCC